MIDLERGRVTLPRYPFPRLKTRVLERSDISEIIDWHPPAIVTADAEVLLVTRLEIDALKAFAKQHDVPFTQRYDAWGDLLDPFLDTEFSSEVQEATRQRLKKRGLLTDAEIDAIRVKVEKPMLRLTYYTWEWVSYGLDDVLMMMKPWPLIGRVKWRVFYAQAMEICLRGETVPSAEE